MERFWKFLSWSRESKEAAGVESMDQSMVPSGSKQNAQEMSMLRPGGVKHKIFLSHAGAEKDFVEQLHEDLVKHGYLFPFFDKRLESLLKGMEFAPVILEAARMCQVAVIVLSEEFLSSKWAMVELATFHGSQQGENQGLKMFPLFYKLSVLDLGDGCIKEKWMPKWREHAMEDKKKRIDVDKWSAAVRALRGANGEVFGKYVTSEVEYRSNVVRAIFKLSPPDLLSGCRRSVVAYDRLCEAVAGKFVNDEVNGAQVLGVYGGGGFGKTVLCRALCDYFHGEFLGRVFHLELDMALKAGAKKQEKLVLRRQKLVLAKLFGIEQDVLGRLENIGQGWEQIRQFAVREPVFLIIDNITNSESVRKEVVGYLGVQYHRNSKIMMSSRSKDIVEEFLPGLEFCMQMPNLTEDEAGVIFLRHAAPQRSMCSLTDQERLILEKCIDQCRFSSGEWFAYDKSWGNYHPLALSALGDFFYKISNMHLLSWKKYLEDKEESQKLIYKCSSVFSVLGLQFSTFEPIEQLVFLDLALFFFRGLRYDVNLLVILLSKLHEVSEGEMELIFRDLKRSGMINSHSAVLSLFDNGNYYTVPEIYREFAKWYVTNEGRGPRNVWGVVQKGSSGPSSRKKQRCNASALKSWSNLVRLSVFDLEDVSRLLPGRRFQDLCNLVVLHLDGCDDLTVLSLEGLHCLRVLKLWSLYRLVTLVLGGISRNYTWTKRELRQSEGIYNSLLMVELVDVSCLVHLPDLSSCTSLEHINVVECYALSLCSGMECSRLKRLYLFELTRSQFAELPNFMSLSSLVELSITIIDDTKDFSTPLQDFRDFKDCWDSEVCGDSEVSKDVGLDSKEAVDRSRELHLDGLKFCKHLKSLLLHSRDVVSIHGLGQLTGLQILSLDACQSLEVIVGLSPLCPLGIHCANLGSLEFLNFQSDDYPFRDLYLDKDVDLAVIMKSR